MSKQFWAVIVVIVLIFIGIFAFSNNGTPGGNSNNSGTPSQHIEGKGLDHVTLVEYGDYECPYCGQYYPIVKQVVSQYSNQITFQFRNFPLTSIHPNAFAGARAAEAASLMGKFWQMHDLLYEQNGIYYNSNQTANTWVGASNPLPYFDNLAKQLGLNVNKFNQYYNSNRVDNTINADMAAGNKLGVNATPTFYLDGKKISVGESVANFQTLINAAIAQKTGHAGTSSTSAGTTNQTKASSPSKP